MKARHIKRLRKVVSKFEVFTVIPSRGLFGEFSPLTETRTNLYSFKAENCLWKITR